eukprot:GHVU01226600.1.p1 GENE.GHVU01226600.1~~GHVU01226600.1.p1  ORF type:complete len:450 (+),score=31.23 GHVU01226600.1:283-1632(+)
MRMIALVIFVGVCVLPLVLGAGGIPGSSNTRGGDVQNTHGAASVQGRAAATNVSRREATSAAAAGSAVGVTGPEAAASDSSASRKAWVFRYYSQESSKWVCGRCKSSGSSKGRYALTTSTSSLRYHLLNEHGITSEGETSNQMILTLGMNVARRKRPAEPGIPCTAARKNIIDELARDWLISGCHPLSTVEEAGFREFVSALDPNYACPCRKTMTAWILEHWNKRLQKVVAWLNSLGTDLRVSVSADKWTSAASKGYLDINMHVIDAQWKPHCVCIGFVRVMHPHTADRIATYIMNAVRRMGPAMPCRVWTLTSDSENLMDATVESMNRLKAEAVAEEADRVGEDSGEGVTPSARQGLTAEEELAEEPLYFTPGKVVRVPCVAHVFHHGAKEGESAMTLMADSLGKTVHARVPVSVCALQRVAARVKLYQWTTGCVCVLTFGQATSASS